MTITGARFGKIPPIGASNNGTFCGPYSANGEVYEASLYFTDGGLPNFEAGYGTAPSNANCVGIIVVSWSPKRVVLRFGNAYGTFDHWYLSNGDDYAIKLRKGIFGGTVTGLT
jgi:hypothetical protein